MMDSEWVGRAGILAEAVAFVLVAPEILGKERLRQAEESLEERMKRATDRARLVPLMSIVGLLFLSVTIAFLGIVRVDNKAPGSWNLLSPWPYLIWVGASFAGWVLVQSTPTAVTWLLLGARRLLSGPDRLRALVFGTGLVLLFGGLGAQFVATF